MSDSTGRRAVSLGILSCGCLLLALVSVGSPWLPAGEVVFIPSVHDLPAASPHLRDDRRRFYEQAMQDRPEAMHAYLWYAQARISMAHPERPIFDVLTLTDRGQVVAELRVGGP